MLEKLKNYFLLRKAEKYISNDNFDDALEILNALISESFLPAKTYLIRGELCHKLLMYEDAYSDYTYVITHCVDKEEALYKRMVLNYEISNYAELLSDAEMLMKDYLIDSEILRYKFLALVMLKSEKAIKFVLEINNNNKYKAIQYIFLEAAKCTALNDFAKGLTLLSTIDGIDYDNPMKIFNEANIYGLAGNEDKKQELMKKIESVFPKYFISHFRFTDMFQSRDLMEISFLLELKIFDKQNYFAYPMYILQGYKDQMEGHITDAKEAFEAAVNVNPNKPEGYVLLAQTLQLMSGYNGAKYKEYAEENYKKAMEIYQKDNLLTKTEDMKRQIKHLNSTINF